MKEGNRTTVTMRLDDPTLHALRKKAKELGTSQSNTIGVALGVTPESAYAQTEKRGKLVTR